jgi:DNA-binding GntR family transcriptional regulator
MIRRIKRRPVVTDVVVDELRTAILSGSLPPGSRVRQEELAARLRVSRLPVRQAFLILRHEGLIASDGGRRTFVAPLDADTIRELYGFRGLIETAVAAALAEEGRLDANAIRGIISKGRRAAAAGDLPRLVQLDCDFHTALYSAVGNRVLLEVMRSQWTHVRRLMSAALSMSGYAVRVWDEHTAILAAILAGDAERAARLSAAHSRVAAEHLIEDLARSKSLASGRRVSKQRRAPRARPALASQGTKSSGHRGHDR